METELNLISDKGSQPTSRSFMETCAGLGKTENFQCRRRRQNQKAKKSVYDPISNLH